MTTNSTDAYEMLKWLVSDFDKLEPQNTTLYLEHIIQLLKTN